MDLAQTLIRSVVRAFYDTKHVLVIDALMIHSALPAEDLALLLGMQQKDLRKLCGKLKEDRLLAMHGRQETREGQQRQINKDYYYIDFHATIDAIKYRIFKLTEQVKDLYKPSQEKKDYHCPRCQSQWTQMEVLDNISSLGEFLCHRCDGVLERDEVSAADMAGHERQSKLMQQLDKLLKLMPLIDSQTIPQNDFETAMSRAVPVQRNEDINPVRRMEVFEPSKNKPTAVKGNQHTQAKIEVSVTTGAEKLANDRAEAQRKADLAAQNALPTWHTQSTVTKERLLTVESEHERHTNRSGDLLEPLKAEEDEKKEGIVLNDELAAYYAQMQQEKEKEAREDAEEDEEDDEDDDEFEDVGIGAGSEIATPSSSISGAANHVNGKATSFTNGTRLKLGSESGSSEPNTNHSTPAASGIIADDDRDGGTSPTKKIKLDDGINGNRVGMGTSTLLRGENEDSDEDEGFEFEDVV